MSAFHVFILLGPLALAILAGAMGWLCFRIEAVPVKIFHLFGGRRLMAFPLFGSLVQVGWLPVGCGITFDIPSFLRKSFFSRMAILLSSPSALFAVAAAVLGAPAALHHFATGFMQLPWGALHPRTAAADMIGHLESVFAESPAMAVGILAAKGAALTLQPLGGSTLVLCLLYFRNKESDSKALDLYGVISLFFGMGIGISWGVAILMQVIAR